MPITPCIAGRLFDPTTLKRMGAAFELACKRLGLTDKADPFTQTVAERVILLTPQGQEDDPVALCERVIKSLEPDSRRADSREMASGRLTIPSMLESKQLPQWRVIRLEKIQAPTRIGLVEAPDKENAIKEAIQKYGITNPHHQRRLAAYRIS